MLVFCCDGLLTDTYPVQCSKKKATVATTHLLSHRGSCVSAKCDMNIFWWRKCSVSYEQVSVCKLYPFGLWEKEADLTRPLFPAPPPSCSKWVGSKSRLATHTAGLHTVFICIRTCICRSHIRVYTWNADWNITAILGLWQRYDFTSLFRSLCFPPPIHHIKTWQLYLPAMQWYVNLYFSSIVLTFIKYVISRSYYVDKC